MYYIIMSQSSSSRAITDDYEVKLLANWREFSEKFASEGKALAANDLNPFLQKMLGKGYMLYQLGDFLSSIIYFSIALWLYAMAGNTNQNTINAAKQMIVDARQKYKSSFVSNKEDTPAFVPSNKDEMMDKISGKPISFETISGAQNEKSYMMNKFVYPQIYPFLYLTDNNNILLYGLPGTGKTLMAQACVGELNKMAEQFNANFYYIFFNIAADTLRSKWEGGTEKNIALAFKTASDTALQKEKEINANKDEKEPQTKVRSVIFLDEVESIAKSRDKGGDDRAITTLLQQMGGFTPIENVTVIAATNLPWDLDTAFVRRFSGQMFIDVPDFKARFDLFWDTIVAKFEKHYTPLRLFDLKLSKSIDDYKLDDEKNTYENFETILSNLYNSMSEQQKITFERIKGGYMASSASASSSSLINFRNSDEFLTIFTILSLIKLYYRIDKFIREKNLSVTLNQDWISAKVEDYKQIFLFIFKLADITGPFKPALEKLGLLGKRSTNIARSKFGYSASDITKIVAEFFSITASNILRRKFTQEVQSNDCKTTSNPIDKCRIVENDRGELFVSIQDSRDKSKKFMAGRNTDFYAVIFPEYMEEALRQYPTTVGNDPKYCSYLQYKQTGAISGSETKVCAELPNPK